MILRPDQVLAKKYRVVKPIAKGGYAVVYAAYEIATQTPVVAKALKEEAAKNDPSAIARFIREAAIAVHLEHPNIVKVLDLGYTRDGIIYIILERLYGYTLSKVIHKSAVKAEKVVGIITQLLRALAFAHSKGVIHRDMKPSNVFVTDQTDPETGVDLVKILDFGFVKVLKSDNPTFSQPLTMVGKQVGTAGYIAPELLDPNNPPTTVNPQIDLYAIGIIAHELLTGKPAFKGRGMQRVLEQMRRDPEVPTALAKTPLYKVIRKLMARKPERRYKTAGAALKDLRRVAQHLKRV